MKDLIFFITYKCNFACKTCFYKEVIDTSAARFEKEMSVEEIKKVSFSLGRFDNLFISGGEPFLRDDIVEICEIFYKQNNIKKIHLPTNGFYSNKIYEKTREILLKLPKIPVNLAFSLDGSKKTHDEITGIDGSFDKVVQAIIKIAPLKEDFRDLNLSVVTVVNNKNLSEIIELAEFVKNNLPVDSHGPSPVRGDPYDESVVPPTSEEWADLSGKLEKYQNYYNRKRNGRTLKAFLSSKRAGYLYDIYAKVLAGKKLPFQCQAGNIIGVLEPNGDVRLCELTPVVGNVRNTDHDFKAIWDSDLANDMRGKIKNCACTHACFISPSIQMSPLSLIASYSLGRSL